MLKAVYLETHSTDPYYNLAFEEYVLTHRTVGDCLMLWQNDNTIVVGQNQNAEGDINRSFVETHGIRVVRRMTGGGAVYHDLGNLNYSFITDAGDTACLTMERFTRPVVGGAAGAGASCRSVRPQRYSGGGAQGFGHGAAALPGAGPAPWDPSLRRQSGDGGGGAAG